MFFSFSTMASSISNHSLPTYQDTIFSSNPSRIPIINLNGSRNFRASSFFPLISGNSIKRLSKSNAHPRPSRPFTLFCMNDSKASAVTKESWDESVLESKVPVLVEFYASWCGPCRMVHRVIDEIAAEYAGRVKCFVLNTDNDLQIAEDYEIKAVPVVLLFKNGKQQDCVVGTMPKEFYVTAIEKVFAR